MTGEISRRGNVYEVRAGRRPGRGRRIALVALALLLALGLALGSYAFIINRKVAGNIERESMLPTAGSTTGPTGPPPAPASKTIVDKNDRPVTVVDDSNRNSTDPARDPAAGDAQNILLVGEDAGSNDDAQDRADVIVLMHIADDRRSVSLVHFPRDLFVNIPGHGFDKINAAFAVGGAPLLVQTVQQQTGTRIDHVARTNFQSFKDMTDAVGGVDVYAEEASVGSTGTIVKGMNHLNGAQALQFVRERKQLSKGDISRGRRQQAFIRALMLKALSVETLSNPVKTQRFADAATQNVIVDQGWSHADMRALAFSLRGIRGDDIHFATAPYTGLGWTDDRQSIVLKDQEGMRVLGEHLRTDTMDEYVDVEREL